MTLETTQPLSVHLEVSLVRPHTFYGYDHDLDQTQIVTQLPCALQHSPLALCTAINYQYGQFLIFCHLEIGRGSIDQGITSKSELQRKF